MLPWLHEFGLFPPETCNMASQNGIKAKKRPFGLFIFKVSVASPSGPLGNLLILLRQTFRKISRCCILERMLTLGSDKMYTLLRDKYDFNIVNHGIINFLFLP